MEFSLEKLNGKKEFEEAFLNGQEESQPLSLDVVRPRFVEYMGAVQKIETQAEALEVKDEETREQAANLAGGAKKLIKAINAREKEIVGPADTFIKSVRAFASKFTSRLSDAAAKAGRKELDFINLQEMQRREAERIAEQEREKLQKKIDKEAKKKGIEPVQVQAPIIPETETTARTEGGVTSFIVETWKGQITDATKVPREYCEPSMRLINEAIKNGVREISGVNIYLDKQVRHRS